MIHLIEQLEKEHTLPKEDFIRLLENFTRTEMDVLFEKSRNASKKYFSNRIYIRGLIEFTNYCKNNCYYCGIRAGNPSVSRYRLDREEILSCCAQGYGLGFRTFVLQGGEDPHYSINELAEIVSSIRENYPDCAITLSIGERSRNDYEQLFKAGANRYLLRHETADANHYGKLHPQNLTLQHRKECLYHLKETGYQVGTGFMVGSPFQTTGTLAQDLLFIKELGPQMIGIGPFIPHGETPFKQFPQGSLDLTLFLIGILRLMIPNALIPATTALGTIDPNGREMGVLAGANVVMPNLSPLEVRKKYLLYDNKICTGDEAAECIQCLNRRMEKIGYVIVNDRGDFKPATI